MSALPIEDAERKNELEGTTAAPDQLFTELECIRGECVWVKITPLSFSKAPIVFEHFPASTATAVQRSCETQPAARCSAAFVFGSILYPLSSSFFCIHGNDGARCRVVENGGDDFNICRAESRMLNL